MYHLYHCSILRRPLGNRKRISSREVHAQFFFKFVMRGKWSSVFYVLSQLFPKKIVSFQISKKNVLFWLLINSMTVEEFSPPHHFFDKPWSKRWQRNFKSDHHTALPFQFSQKSRFCDQNFTFTSLKQFITSFVFVNGAICIHESLCRSFH